MANLSTRSEGTSTCLNEASGSTGKSSDGIEPVMTD